MEIFRSHLHVTNFAKVGDEIHYGGDDKYKIVQMIFEDGWAVVVAQRILKEGSLGKTRIAFDTKRPFSSFHKYKN